MGFCYDIEKEVAKVLNKAGFLLFRQHFQDGFEQAFAPFESKDTRYIYDYPADVYLNAKYLERLSFIVKESMLEATLRFVRRWGLTPKDCVAYRFTSES